MRRTSHFHWLRFVYLLILFVFICPLAAPGDALATIVPTPTRTRTPTPTVGPQTAGAQLSWSLYTLDDAKSFSQFGSHHFRLKQGQPRLAYGGDHLYYAWYGTGGWHYEVVDNARGVGAHASLAFDSKGMPNISYRDALNKTLKYARKVDQVWQIQTVVTGGVTGHTSIEMDASDHPHITFITDAGLSYATFGALGWEVEQVMSHGTPGEIACEMLALDRQGNPSVAVNDNSSYTNRLRYAARDALGWHVQLIELPRGWEPDGNDIATAIFANGDPYILFTAYVRAIGGDPHEGTPIIASVRRKDGAWSVGIEWSSYSDAATLAAAIDMHDTVYIGVASAGITEFKTSAAGWQTVHQWSAYPPPQLVLALDDQGNPHFSDGIAPYVNHVYKKGEAWTTEIIDTASDVGQSPAIAVDKNGNPGVSFYNHKTLGVELMRWNGTNWNREQVDRNISGSIGTSLAFDANSAARIAYAVEPVGAENWAVRYAEKPATEWMTSTLESPIWRHAFVEDAVSLKLGRDGQAHVAYMGGPQIRYAHQPFGASPETVCPYCGYGQTVGLALDGGDQPHVLYASYWGDHLLYSSRTAAGWQTSTLPSTDFPLYSDLAFDAVGAPHWCSSALADPDRTEQLLYGHLAGGQWQVETVDIAGGEYCSIAVDSGGRPHISYYDPVTGAVKYARLTGSGWVITTVNPNGGAPTSLALDKNDIPYIAYHDTVENALKVAGGKWIVPGPTPTPTATTTSLCRSTPTPHPAYGGTPAPTGIVQRQVAHCMDDAYQITGSTVELRSDTTSLKMGGRPGTSVPYVSYLGGLLFRDVRVPAGSLITSARLKLWPWGDQSGAPVVLELAGERTAQPETFSAGNPWPYVRAKTASRVTWALPSVLGTATYAESPDLAAVIQELVNLPGWQAGRDLSILLGPQSTANMISWAAYDAWAAHAPELVIQYGPRPVETWTPTPTETATPSATETAMLTPSPTATPTAAETVLPTVMPTATMVSRRQTYLPLILVR